jgi:hypothetical protein
MKHNILYTINYLLVTTDVPSDVSSNLVVHVPTKKIIPIHETTSIESDKDYKKIIAHLPLNQSTKLKNIPLLPKLPEELSLPISPDSILIDNMCLRYRHDFGLLDDIEKNGIRIIMKQLYEEVVYHFRKKDDIKVYIWPKSFVSEEVTMPNFGKMIMEKVPKIETNSLGDIIWVGQYLFN